MSGFSIRPDSPFEARLANARRLSEQGPSDEAIAAYREVLALDPTQPEAMRFISMAHMVRGQLNEAISMLRRGVEAHPDRAEFRADLGVALQSSGELEPARAALAAAVTLDPGLEVAHLYLGLVCERMGSRMEALTHYVRAIRTAQRQNRWRNPGSTPAGLHGLVGHAMQFVGSFEEEVCSAIVARLKNRMGGEAVRRVERCTAMLLKQIPKVLPDPRQAPKFLYFPDLPATPYFDPNQFAWVEQLEHATSAIREEVSQVLQQGQQSLEPFLKLSDKARKEDYLTSSSTSPAWDAFFFYRHGRRYDDNAARCPATAAAIDAVPLVRIPGSAPEVLFSVLSPGTRIMPHHGTTNTRVVAHLPLIVPGDAALVVGGQAHFWQEGKVVVFDDTYEHEAYNNSGDTRVVLILDVWNPYLTEIERAAVTEIVSTLNDVRAALEGGGATI